MSEPWKIDGRVISVNAAAKRLNVSRATLYRMIKRGDFPKPVKYPGVTRSGYLDTDIRDFARKAAEKSRESDTP
jgi:predicted DNA-binding transcriptional regulator AlpA